MERWRGAEGAGHALLSAHKDVAAAAARGVRDRPHGRIADAYDVADLMQEPDYDAAVTAVRAAAG
jgi:hypothetical protein